MVSLVTTDDFLDRIYPSSDQPGDPVKLGSVPVTGTRFRIPVDQRGRYGISPETLCHVRVSVPGREFPEEVYDDVRRSFIMTYKEVLSGGRISIDARYRRLFNIDSGDEIRVTLYPLDDVEP